MIAIATLLSVLGVVLTAIAGNLLSNQIETSLPSIARRIVRHQAKKMAPDAARYEEQWLADLDEVRGGLAQLYIAIGTLFVPLRIAIQETPGGLAGWLQQRSGWLIVPAVVILLLFRAYPLEPSRYAAYIVSLALIFLCTLCLAAPLRRAVAVGYERLNYVGRVSIGGLVTPAICVLTIAWSLIPPTRHVATAKSLSHIRDGKNPAVIFLPTLPPANEAKALVLVTGQPKLDERLFDKNLPYSPIARLMAVESSNMPTGDVTNSSSPVSTFVGLEGTALLELPDQPLPAIRETPVSYPEPPRLTPPAPGNLRVIAPSGMRIIQ